MIRYTEPTLERVNLKVISSNMEWGEWSRVVDVLKAFMTDYENVVLNFNVELRGQLLTSIGRGYFQDNSDDSALDKLSQSWDFVKGFYRVKSRWGGVSL